MDIYAPKYYKKFKCIADKCLHSCCIGWEIDIDERTYGKYLSLGKTAKNTVLSTIERSTDTPHFTLGSDGRCKNLDGHGLCKIITALGEGYLCDICRLHPRFINGLGTHTEIGLGLSCEEAARIILTENEPFELVKIGENEELADETLTCHETLKIRNDIIKAVEKREGDIFSSLSKIKEKYGVKTDFYTFEEWVDVLLSLEILSDEWSGVLEKTLKTEPKCDKRAFDSHFEALFKYLVFRHLPPSESELERKARIAFAALLTELAGGFFERESVPTEASLLNLVRLLSSELEYSEENTEALILELETELL